MREREQSFQGVLSLAGGFLLAVLAVVLLGGGAPAVGIAVLGSAFTATLLLSGFLLLGARAASQAKPSQRQTELIMPAPSGLRKTMGIGLLVPFLSFLLAILGAEPSLELLRYLDVLPFEVNPSQPQHKLAVLFAFFLFYLLLFRELLRLDNYEFYVSSRIGDLHKTPPSLLERLGSLLRRILQKVLSKRPTQPGHFGASSSPEVNQPDHSRNHPLINLTLSPAPDEVDFAQAQRKAAKFMYFLLAAVIELGFFLSRFHASWQNWQSENNLQEGLQGSQEGMQRAWDVLASPDTVLTLAAMAFTFAVALAMKAGRVGALMPTAWSRVQYLRRLYLHNPDLLQEEERELILNLTKDQPPHPLILLGRYGVAVTFVVGAAGFLTYSIAARLLGS